MRITANMASVLLLAIPLCAQSFNTVGVTVPFSFTVANRTVAPGHYSIASLGVSNSIRLWTQDARVNIAFLALGSAQPETYPAGFVFNKYGDRYFLSEVHRDDGIGWFVPKCKQERELVTSRITAASGVRVEQVVILARTR